MHRYSHREFPPYRYTPGENPHPTISSEGHSYGLSEPVCERESQEAVDFLSYGIDLLNHHYFWECHEVCEYLWKQWPRESDEACILQALILLAVAQLHTRRNKPLVAIKVAIKGLKKIEGVRGHYHGIQQIDLQLHLQHIAHDGALRQDVSMTMCL